MAPGSPGGVAGVALRSQVDTTLKTQRRKTNITGFSIDTRDRHAQGTLVPLAEEVRARHRRNVGRRIGDLWLRYGGELVVAHNVLVI